MATKLQDIRPVLSVTDMEETVLFYCNVLGFECVSRMEGWMRCAKTRSNS
jgi:catechol 2,3-dioxygenase-like lactoylglutathione lyase family enzyme